MKQIIFVFLIFFTGNTFAQSVGFSANDSTIISNINTVLSTVKSGNSKILYDFKELDINALSEVDKNKYPDLWERQTKEKVKLFLYVLSELANYLHDNNDLKNARPFSEPIIPPCYKDTSFIQYPHQPQIEEINDAECKAIFLRLLKEREELKKKHDYLIPIQAKYLKIEFYLVDYFKASNFLTINDLEKYLALYENDFFTNESKKKYFRSNMNYYLRSKK